MSTTETEQREYKIDVGFDGEGYSRRTITVLAVSEEAAKETALAWYYPQCSAHLIGPDGRSARKDVGT